MPIKNNNLKIIIFIAVYAMVSSIIATSVMVVIELLGLKILLLYIISYAVIMAIDIFVLYYAINAILTGYNKIIRVLNQPAPDNNKIVIPKKPVELGDSENAIIAILEKNNGKVLQNSLTSKTGYSAPTISRILTGLEEKGIIDRQRHGMTNEIVLKER